MPVNEFPLSFHPYFAFLFCFTILVWMHMCLYKLFVRFVFTVYMHDGGSFYFTFYLGQILFSSDSLISFFLGLRSLVCWLLNSRLYPNFFSVFPFIYFHVRKTLRIYISSLYQKHTWEELERNFISRDDNGSSRLHVIFITFLQFLGFQRRDRKDADLYAYAQKRNPKILLEFFSINWLRPLLFRMVFMALIPGDDLYISVYREGYIDLRNALLWAVL